MTLNLESAAGTITEHHRQESPSESEAKKNRFPEAEQSSAAAAQPYWVQSPFFYKRFLLAAAFLAAFLLLDGSATASQAWEGAPGCYLPLGLVLMLLLCGGPGYWPLLFVSSLTAAVVNYHRPIFSWAGIPGSTSIYFAYIAGAAILRGPWRIDLKLASLRDVGKFTLVFLGAAILSAPFGMLTLLGDGLIHRPDALKTTLEWLASDVVSIVTFAPLLLVHVAPRVSSWLKAKSLVQSSPVQRRAISTLQVVETAAQAGIIVLAIWLAFCWAPSIPYQPRYLLFIPVVWAAVRHGLPGATLATFLINVGITLTAGFVRAPSGSMPRLQLAMLTLGLTGLCLGSIVTERWRSESRLLSKSALLEAQANSTIDGILVVDDQGQRLMHNQTVVEMFRIPADILADNVDQHMLAHLVTLVKDPYQYMARIHHLNNHVGETSRDEIELKDGRTLDRYSAPVIDQAGKYYGRIWTFRDITEKKQADSDLQASQEKFRQLAENIREVFWMSTPAADKILYVSPAYEEVWGRTRESVYGDPMSWAAAIHPDDMERAHSAAEPANAR